MRKKISTSDGMLSGASVGYSLKDMTPVFGAGYEPTLEDVSSVVAAMQSKKGVYRPSLSAGGDLPLNLYS